MSDDNQAARSEAARAMGRARTPLKVEKSRASLTENRKSRWDTPGARERQAQAVRDAALRRKEAREAEAKALDG